MFTRRDCLRGKIFSITDPQLKAVAVKACNPPLLGGTSSSVNIVNGRNAPIFVGFTTIDHKPGPVTWGNGCTKTGTRAMIANGATCIAMVSSNGVASRFCASLSGVPTDCFNAQVNHQTMVETNFEPASNPGCFNKGNCVWFDISVIPSTCTDALWKQNQCAGTGVPLIIYRFRSPAMAIQFIRAKGLRAVLMERQIIPACAATRMQYVRVLPTASMRIFTQCSIPPRTNTSRTPFA
jgi:hypothetical protein